MAIRKNLTSIGSSLGLIIDKPIADLYDLDRNTMVEISPKEDGLEIHFLKKNKSSRATDDEVVKAAQDVNKRYGKMMRNLAK